MNPHGSTYIPKHLWPQISPLWSKVHFEASVATEKSMPQQVHLTVSLSMDKAMPEYLGVPVAVVNTTTRQVSV